MPCVISIEPGEAIFSLAIRYCRWSDVDLQLFLFGNSLTERTGFRDFPVAVSRLESAFHTNFVDRDSLLTRHSAATYYATTLPEPFRSESLEKCTKTVSGLLRISIASNWPHLRFCRQCAALEFDRCRYSWWHRDHQLPLESICTIHRHPLECLRLDQLGLRLPHEFLDSRKSSNQRDTHTAELEKIVSRFERGLTTGKGRRILKVQCEHIMSQLRSISGDYVEQSELVMPGMRKLVLALRDQRVRELSDDRDRVSAELQRLLRDGFDYGDVIAAVLLVISLTYPHSFGWDSLPKSLQDVWRRRNCESVLQAPSC